MPSRGETVTQSSENPNLEPHEGIDPYDNAETRATEANQSSYVGRAGQGPPPTPPRMVGEEAPPLEGTAAGDPLAGVVIDPADAEDAVSGDTGPEHPGTRRST